MIAENAGSRDGGPSHWLYGTGLGDASCARWRLSNTMDAWFCVEALNEALARYGRPEIFNIEQDHRASGAA